MSYKHYDYDDDGGKRTRIENFQNELQHLLNKHSMEQESNTSDFVLAEYLTNCLRVYNTAIKERDYLKLK